MLLSMFDRVDEWSVEQKIEAIVDFGTIFQDIPFQMVELPEPMEHLFSFTCREISDIVFAESEYPDYAIATNNVPIIACGFCEFGNSRSDGLCKLDHMHLKGLYEFVRKGVECAATSSKFTLIATLIDSKIAEGQKTDEYHNLRDLVMSKVQQNEGEAEEEEEGEGEAST